MKHKVLLIFLLTTATLYLLPVSQGWAQPGPDCETVDCYTLNFHLRGLVTVIQKGPNYYALLGKFTNQREPFDVPPHSPMIFFDAGMTPTNDNGDPLPDLTVCDPNQTSRGRTVTRKGMLLNHQIGLQVQSSKAPFVPFDDPQQGKPDNYGEYLYAPHIERIWSANHDPNCRIQSIDPAFLHCDDVHGTQPQCDGKLAARMQLFRGSLKTGDTWDCNWQFTNTDGAIFPPQLVSKEMIVSILEASGPITLELKELDTGNVSNIYFTPSSGAQSVDIWITNQASDCKGGSTDFQGHYNLFRSASWAATSCPIPQLVRHGICHYTSNEQCSPSNAGGG